LGRCGRAGRRNYLVGSQLHEEIKARTPSARRADKFMAYAELTKDEGIIKIHYAWLGERVSLDPTIRVKASYLSHSRTFTLMVSIIPERGLNMGSRSFVVTIVLLLCRVSTGDTDVVRTPKVFLYPIAFSQNH